MASREEQKFATALKKLGINVDGAQSIGELIKSGSKFGHSDNMVVSASEKAAVIKQDLKMAAERAELEAESVLYYVEVRGKGFHDKICKSCGQPFASTYLAVAFCSNACRAVEIAKSGVVWNLYGKTDLERWGGRIPKVIGPNAYIAALQAVESLPEMAEEEPEEEVDLDNEEADIFIQEVEAAE